MSDNKYAGAGPVPKGKQRASMKEAAEMGQIRYYGIKKIDSKTIENAKKQSKPDTRKKLLLKLVTLRATISRNKGRYEGAKEDDKKKEYLKLWKDAEKEIKKVSDKLKSMEADK